MATEGNVAVMRYLQSIVESMAANNVLPPFALDRSSDKKVANNFEQLLENAEKRIHFNERKGNDDPLQLLSTPDPATVANGVGDGQSSLLPPISITRGVHHHLPQVSLSLVATA